jgi:hypothetical protein
MVMASGIGWPAARASSSQADSWRSGSAYRSVTSTCPVSPPFAWAAAGFPPPLTRPGLVTRCARDPPLSRLVVFRPYRLGTRSRSIWLPALLALLALKRGPESRDHRRRRRRPRGRRRSRDYDLHLRQLPAAGDAAIKSLALALAVGVACDALLVRMTIVPAVLALAGKRAWYIPRWLSRLLPDLDIEGSTIHQRSSAASADSRAAEQRHGAEGSYQQRASASLELGSLHTGAPAAHAFAEPANEPHTARAGVMVRLGPPAGP